MTPQERAQAEYNVRAFERDVKSFTGMRDRARLPSRKAHWQKKLDFAAHCREDNKRLLEEDAERITP